MLEIENAVVVVVVVVIFFKHNGLCVRLVYSNYFYTEKSIHAQIFVSTHRCLHAHNHGHNL